MSGCGVAPMQSSSLRLTLPIPFSEDRVSHLEGAGAERNDLTSKQREGLGLRLLQNSDGVWRVEGIKDDSPAHRSGRAVLLLSTCPLLVLPSPFSLLFLCPLRFDTSSLYSQA